jgi:hypothetical protein
VKFFTAFVVGDGARNFGQISGWTMTLMCIATAIGYAFARDWRRTLYFLFAAAINATVIA